MKNKVIHTLIQKFYNNSLSVSSQIAFRRWFIDESGKDEKLKALENQWEATEAFADEATEKDLSLLYLRIRKEQSVKRQVIFQKLLRVAAFFILPLLGACLTYVFMQKQGGDDLEWTECFAANGQRKEIILSDGTTVWLNSGSVLLYTKEFKRKERTLYLNGEAIFSVAEDVKRPFIVKTNHMDVEALGTIFNVEAYSDAEYTTTTLEEGRVRVNVEDKESMILLPDQQIRYNNITGSITHETVDAYRVLQWKHGYVIFQKVSFDIIMQTLERKFDVRINYESNKFAGRNFNLKIYPDEDIYHTLDVVKEMMPGLQYKISNNIIFIY